MIEPIKQLKHYNSRLTTVLNELEILEDYEDADYSEFVTDFGFLTVQLEQRRDRLMKRGRCLWGASNVERRCNWPVPSVHSSVMTLTKQHEHTAVKNVIKHL